MKLLLSMFCMLCITGLSMSAQIMPSDKPFIMNLRDGTQWISRDNGKNWQPYAAERHAASSGDAGYSDFGVSRLDAAGLSVTLPVEATESATVSVVDILGNVLYQNTTSLNHERRFEIRNGTFAFPTTLLAVTVTTGGHTYRTIVPPSK